jgi:cobalt-zinc-cadmium efflux system membrane fusion protein
MAVDNMTGFQTPRASVRWRASMLGLVGLSLVIGAFLLGRWSSLTVGDTTVVRAGNPEPHDGDAHTGHAHELEEAHQGHGHEGHDHGNAQEPEGHVGEEGHGEHEEGVVHFTPEALARAGVQVQTVAVTSLRSHLQVTGTVEANIAELVKVTPQVAGKITSLRANIGDRVRAGQVLATMTSTELAAAQAQYRQAGARVSAARANLQRQRQLAGFGEFGQHKVQEARGNFNAAQGDVNEAIAEINAARNEVAEAQAALAAAQSDEVSAQSDVAAAETAVAQAKTQVDVTASRFQRQEALLKEELTSRQEWEQARADFRKAQTDVLAAEAAHRSAQARVAAAHAKMHQADSVIQTHQARVRQAQAKLTAARQRLAIAGEAREREEKIFKSGVYASKEVADAEAALRHAEIDRTTAADAVRLLGGLPGNGNTIGIASPITGRVTQRTVSIGETLSPEKPVFTVLNLNTVWVQLNVYQRDLSSIRVGLPVTTSTDAVPGRQFTGAVSYIGDGVDETTRTVKVRCVIPNPGGRLKPDMFVRGHIATAVRGRGIVVPREAVQTQEGKTVVFVQGDHPGEFEAKEVRTGETVDGQTMIASGLEPGERVVTRGAFIVKAQAMKAELGHSHAH